ncbi:MAG TPA: hypothetical protein VME46_11895 [Acidimicrobiales bacterium]|nr:hypothetical protein [Acidimicrobiales bacterium]
MNGPRGGPSKEVRGECGEATALGLVLGVSFVLLPVMVLVLAIPTWEERSVDARDLARAAARALAVAGDWALGVMAAEDVVIQAEADDGLPASDVTTDYSGDLAPGGTVSVSVTVAIPVGDLPGLGLIGTLHYAATCTEYVDAFRGSP